MRILPYIGPVVRLVNAAKDIPSDFRDQPADQAWLAGMVLPESEILALAAGDILGPPVVMETVETEEALAAAFLEAGCPENQRGAVLYVATELASAASGEPLKVEAKDSAVISVGFDPGTWAMIIQIVLALIEAIRKRRQGV